MQTIQFNYITLTEEIKQRLDLVDIVSDHIDLKRKGKRYWGLCPFHAEKTPSFSVSPEKQMFYCFGCGERGDIFTFIMKYHNIDFKAARDLLAARTGIKLDTQSRAEYQRIQAARNRRAQEKEVASKLQSVIDSEYKRLIRIERWCDLFLKFTTTERDLDRPAVIWALKTKDITAYCLDMLLKPGIAERLEALKISRGIESWTRNC